VSIHSTQVASQVVATSLYKEAYGDDPTNGTVSVATLARLLNEPTPNGAVFLEATRYVGTQAYEQLKSAVPPSVREYLQSTEEAVTRTVDYYQSHLLDINSKSDWRRRNAKKHWRWLTELIDARAEQVAEALRSQAKEAKQTKAQRHLSEQISKGKPAIDDTNDGWYPLFVSKPPLDIPHTGKLGRRIMYTNEGKYPRNIGRLMTDPERRIFTRKTRSLGAVVVIDCSGSMSLTEDDLKALMKSSSGATVLCYSTGNYPDESNPNAWVVARRGRQIRRLPEFPGGNGCDAPALKYGVSLRSSSVQPVIWVSDQQVTGLGDRSNENLRQQCRNLVRKHGIITARNVKQAIREMTKLQGGK
jgi:hypothetical protein